MLQINFSRIFVYNKFGFALVACFASSPDRRYRATLFFVIVAVANSSLNATSLGTTASIALLKASTSVMTLSLTSFARWETDASKVPLPKEPAIRKRTAHETVRFRHTAASCGVN